jgi:hypothetical protein
MASIVQTTQKTQEGGTEMPARRRQQDQRQEIPSASKCKCKGLSYVNQLRLTAG